MEPSDVHCRNELEDPMPCFNSMSLDSGSVSANASQVESPTHALTQVVVELMRDYNAGHNSCDAFLCVRVKQQLKRQSTTRSQARSAAATAAHSVITWDKSAAVSAGGRAGTPGPEWAPSACQDRATAKGPWTRAASGPPWHACRTWWVHVGDHAKVQACNVS